MPVLLPHAKLASLLGETKVETSAVTVGELLREMESRVAPDAWRDAKRATILVNGRNIHYLNGFNTQLAPDDQVWMVLPSGGG